MDSTTEALEYGEHTEAATRAMRQQAEMQAAAEARRRTRAMVVPTDDREVRVWLRRLNEPVTLFGERAMERRERLRGLMATLSDEQRMKLTARVMQLDVEQKKTQLDRFFTEGAAELISLRRRICAFAAKRAGQRLAVQQAAFEDNGESLAEERQFVLKDASRLHNVSSQIGGRRPLQGCEISPDGTTLATADWDGVVSMWTLEDKLVRLSVSQAHEQRCTDIRWHPHALSGGSDSVATDVLAYSTASADGTAKLWSIRGNCLHTLSGHTGRLARSAFHPAGETLATCSYDGTWRLWDVHRGALLLEQEGHSRAVYSIAFHPDGSLCCSGSMDAAARVWDCRTGRSILTFQGHTYGVLSVGFSPNGYHVATGSLDNSVRVWDLRRRGALYCIAGHVKLVSHVQFDPLGGHYLLSTSYDTTAKVWNSHTWQLTASLAGHSGVVMAADIARDGAGSIVTTSFDKGIKLWKPSDDDSALEPMEEE